MYVLLFSLVYVNCQRVSRSQFILDEMPHFLYNGSKTSIAVLKEGSSVVSVTLTGVQVIRSRKR